MPSDLPNVELAADLEPRILRGLDNDFSTHSKDRKWMISESRNNTGAPICPVKSCIKDLGISVDGRL